MIPCIFHPWPVRWHLTMIPTEPIVAHATWAKPAGRGPDLLTFLIIYVT